MTKEITVYFSPRAGCTDAVVHHLNQTKKTIFIQAYTFTSPDIFNALIAAKNRGISIQIILDKFNSEAKGSLFTNLLKADVPVYLDSKHRCAHNKIMILDGKKVLTGSFNFTVQAEKSNAENLLVIDSKELAAIYQDNWQLHQEHSQLVSSKKKVKVVTSLSTRFIHWLTDVLDIIGHLLQN